MTKSSLVSRSAQVDTSLVHHLLTRPSSNWRFTIRGLPRWSIRVMDMFSRTFYPLNIRCWKNIRRRNTRKIAKTQDVLGDLSILLSQWSDVGPSCEKIETIDRAFLHHLVTLGFISQTPSLSVIPSSAGPPDAQTVSLAALPSRSHIEVPLDPSGRLVGKGLAPSSPASWERWFALLHEVGHCVFHERPQVFCPTLPNPSRDHLLNKWVFNPLFLSPGRSLMEEGFADAFAAAVLLHVSGHDPSAQACIKEVACRRKETQRILEENQNSEGAEPPSCWSGLYETDVLLEKILSLSWSSKSSQEILNEVSTMASDAWLFSMSPSRRMASGRVQGFGRWKEVERLAVSPIPDMMLLEIQASVSLDSTPLKERLAHRLGDHPVLRWLSSFEVNYTPSEKKRLQSGEGLPGSESSIKPWLPSSSFVQTVFSLPSWQAVVRVAEQECKGLSLSGSDCVEKENHRSSPLLRKRSSFRF